MSNINNEDLSIISPFKPIKLIGIGGFCRVYEGSMDGYDSPIAIKAVSS